MRNDAPVTKELAILERPVYGVSEAARLLGLRPDRARAWLDGHERSGVRYPPVIREEPTGDDLVTWGEFVELGYLREYRRARVSLQHIRPVIERLRHEFGVRYPLAHSRPWVYDRQLVLRIQEETHLDPWLAIVIRSGQELILAREVESYLQKVGSRQRRPRIRPAGKTTGRHRQVLLRRPSIRGVATERIAELYRARQRRSWPRRSRRRRSTPRSHDRPSWRQRLPDGR
jgi:hypothetical protein